MVNVDNRGTGPRRGSGSSMWFIIGALVVAVLIIGWFFMGGDAPEGDADLNVTTEGTTPAPAGDTNVNVTPPAADTNVTVTPPAADTTPAPAEPATPPPAGDTTTPAPAPAQ